MKLVFFLFLLNFFSLITCFIKKDLNQFHKRCQFVDDGFVTKDCGLAPTLEEFHEFLKKQALQVAQFAKSNPCGFTICSKFKRDLEFNYQQLESRSTDLISRQSSTSLLSDDAPVTASADGTLSLYGTVPIPAPMKATKRDVKDEIQSQKHKRSVFKRSLDEHLSSRSILKRSLHEPISSRSLSKRNSNEKPPHRSLLKRSGLEPVSSSHFMTRQVTSTSLLADNKPVTASADGTLSVYGTVEIAPPVTPVTKRELKVLDMKVKENHIRSFVYEEGNQMSSIEIRQETTKTLMADNQPVTGLPDGTLAVYGTVPITPPVKRDLDDEHELFERDDLIDEFLNEARVEKRENESEIMHERRARTSRKMNDETVLELIKRKQDVSEDELIVRNLPMMIGKDGKMYLFGSRL
ncbi:uncharacterized protein MELLADRAFT_105937 [Melampsora larici-populina 98AG31]|uniref:Secreted protein n=1 Tax=Melampsora larici-populina (strain 98AG31 / pathotype 3-4-7) TaxID=747676 RepID=F4RJU0_MELLP|nr:uncharacterized protein MELLADRAFT_105937 [Melampsora larici-populina 98AG31]EGG07372.1 hypothetical protein MELLADRAFT_105937 [Melampsora larici-populina 98AG31]